MNTNPDMTQFAEPSPSPAMERPFRLKLAGPADIDAVMSLLTAYYAELPMFRCLTPDAVRARRFRLALLQNAIPHILGLWHGQPIGLIAWRYDTTFSVEPIGHMSEFYVLPQYRKSPVGKALLSAALDVAKHEGVKLWFAEIASGLPTTPSLKNLYRKLGASEIGAVMHLEL